jgi:hypothetical protein
MAMLKATYDEVRSQMRPGDVVAFGGKGDFSQIIKWATRAPVSHTGVLLQTQLASGSSGSDFYNQIIESTTIDGFSGVSMSNLSTRMSYDGEVWWLPLGETARAAFQEKAFSDFLLRQDHKPFDVPQAIKSALDALDHVPLVGQLTHNREDFDRFFCSELVAAGLEVAKVISHINASEVTPIDLCTFAIYAPDYYQLKGPDKEIKGYNNVDPTGWGE